MTESAYEALKKIGGTADAPNPRQKTVNEGDIYFVYDAPLGLERSCKLVMTKNISSYMFLLHFSFMFYNPILFHFEIAVITREKRVQSH